MRLSLRVRTALVLVAVAGVSLGYVAVRWRRAGFAFQMRHAIRANAYWHTAWQEGIRAENLGRCAAPGHRCPLCGQLERPINELIADALHRQAAARRAAWWNALIAGPAVDHPRFDAEL